MLRSILAAGLLASTAACASAPSGGYALVPQAANGKDLRSVTQLTPGTTIESRVPGARVLVRATDQFPDYGAAFAVAVQNVGDAPVSFGVESIAATSGARALRIYTADELGDEIKTSAKEVLRTSERKEDITSSPTRDLQSARYTVSREESLNTYGGCPAGQGRCQIDSSDSGAAYRRERYNRLANLQTSVDMAAKLAVEDAAMRKVLRTASIEPGAMGGGLVVIEHPRPGETVDLVVTFAGQKHNFTFAAAPKG